MRLGMMRAVHRREEPIRVLWDEVPPGRAGSPSAAGILLFLWPQLRGDRRWPAWTRRPGDPEDERTAWWNREDGKVSAALLRPWYVDLVAFLSERAGPARFEPVTRSQAVREYLRGLVIGPRRLFGPGSLLARSTTLDDLVALVEGAGEGGREACTVTFGTPTAAILHARRDERCLWLWLAADLREAFDRFLEEAGGRFLFHRGVMDWSMTGEGLTAPAVIPPSSAWTRSP